MSLNFRESIDLVFLRLPHIVQVCFLLQVAKKKMSVRHLVIKSLVSVSKNGRQVFFLAFLSRRRFLRTSKFKFCLGILVWAISFLLAYLSFLRI